MSVGGARPGGGEWNEMNIGILRNILPRILHRNLSLWKCEVFWNTKINLFLVMQFIFNNKIKHVFLYSNIYVMYFFFVRFEILI